MTHVCLNDSCLPRWRHNFYIGTHTFASMTHACLNDSRLPQWLTLASMTHACLAIYLALAIQSNRYSMLAWVLADRPPTTSREIITIIISRFMMHPSFTQCYDRRRHLCEWRVSFGESIGNCFTLQVLSPQNGHNRWTKQQLHFRCQRRSFLGMTSILLSSLLPLE